MIATAVVSAAGIPSPAGAALAERWKREVPNGWFYWSSPVIADANGDGSNDVVVGGLDGKVHVWDAAGNYLRGSEASGPVASSPAVGDVDGDGRPETVVGYGALDGAFSPDLGGVNIFNADGRRRCSLASDPRHAHAAVTGTPALGDVTGDGINDIVFGGHDHSIRVVDGNCNLIASFDNRDSIFSSPALYDVQGDGTAEIFIGGDATENRSVSGDSHDGGYFRSLRYQPGSPALVQRWQRTSTEGFQSSAAIGDVDGDRDLEVVTASGGFYCRHWNPPTCGDSNKVWAFDLDDGSDTPNWPKRTSMETTYLGNPALGDIDGDGRTDVAVVTNQYDQGHKDKVPNGGALDVFWGHGGRGTHVAQGDGELLTAPVIVDIDGGLPEVVIGYAGHMMALNKDLAVVQSGFGPNLAHKTAAAVGKLGNGWALVTAGFPNMFNRTGFVHAYDIPAPASAPWPQFQMDQRRMGNDLYAPNAPKSPRDSGVPVTAPPTTKPPVTTTTKPKAPPTTRATAPPTTKPPATTTAPPPETTTTLPPETTTTLPPETTTTSTTIEDTTELLAGRETEEDGGSALPWVLLGLVAVGGGGGGTLLWRRRNQG